MIVIITFSLLLIIFAFAVGYHNGFEECEKHYHSIINQKINK